MEKEHSNFIATMYVEIGSHLRATDEKRDNLVGIYLMTVILLGSALVALISKVTNLTSEISIFSSSLLLVFIAIGEILTFANIGARKWHAEYVNCLIILQHISFVGSKNNLLEVVPPEKRETFHGSFFTSRSFLLVQTGLLVTFFLEAVFLKNLFEIGFWIYLVIINLFVLLFLVNRHIAITILNKSEKTFWSNPFKTWCLSGIENILYGEVDDV